MKIGIIDLCKQIEDPRMNRKKVHKMETIIYISIAAVICGAQSWNEIEEFGNVKIVFDISCVVVAVILSFLFFHKLVGTREGTIIAAFCTGFVVKFFSKFITAPLERFLKKNIGE